MLLEPRTAFISSPRSPLPGLYSPLSAHKAVHTVLVNDKVMLHVLLNRLAFALLRYRKPDHLIARMYSRIIASLYKAFDIKRSQQ